MIAYATDLIGNRYSDKPNPKELSGSFYTFETWADQFNGFCFCSDALREIPVRIPEIFYY